MGNVQGCFAAMGNVQLCFAAMNFADLGRGGHFTVWMILSQDEMPMVER